MIAELSEKIGEKMCGSVTLREVMKVEVHSG